jgi:hypothetical protein
MQCLTTDVHDYSIGSIQTPTTVGKLEKLLIYVTEVLMAISCNIITDLIDLDIYQLILDTDILNWG